jgi:hypothetical protein
MVTFLAHGSPQGSFYTEECHWDNDDWNPSQVKDIQYGEES